VTDRSFTLDARSILAADNIDVEAVWCRLAAGDEAGVILLRLAFDIALHNAYAWTCWRRGDKNAMLGHLYQGDDAHEEYKRVLHQWQQPTAHAPDSSQPQALRP
jgi:hypothetical protein